MNKALGLAATALVLVPVGFVAFVGSAPGGGN